MYALRLLHSVCEQSIAYPIEFIVHRTFFSLSLTMHEIYIGIPHSHFLHMYYSGPIAPWMTPTFASVMDVST